MQQSISSCNSAKNKKGQPAGKRHKQASKGKGAVRTPGQSLLEAVDSVEDVPSREKSSRDPAPFLVTDARIPMEYWSEGWMFKAIDDLLWQTMTRDAQHTFPATLRTDRKTHPGYVTREIGDDFVELCPLTTRHRSLPRIPAGSRLEPTGFPMDKTSYVVTSAASRLPRNNDIFPILPKFLGIFPPEKLER